MAADWFDGLSFTRRLRPVLAQHGPRIVASVLLGALAIEAGVIVTRNVGGSGVAVPMPVPGTTAPAHGQTDLRAIVDAHLFGQAVIADTEARPTSMPLVLAGVLALQDPSQGMAILGPTPTQGKLYSVGAAVPGGARLHAVYPDHVVLDRGGTLESLVLPRKTAASAPPPASMAAQLPAASAPPPAQRIQAIAQRRNSGILGGLIRAQAVFQQGRLQGYRIFPGTRADPEVFSQLGLRPGDMITAVNGTMLDDANRANEILETLSSASSARLGLIRNGTQVDVSVDLASVASEVEHAAGEAPAAAPPQPGMPPTGAMPRPEDF
jgi:general secretion pathway protein C